MRKRDAKDKEKKKVREQKGIRIKSVLSVINISLGMCGAQLTTKIVKRLANHEWRENMR